MPRLWRCFHLQCRRMLVQSFAAAYAHGRFRLPLPDVSRAGNRPPKAKYTGGFYVDRIARGDRDYFNSRRVVAARLEQRKNFRATRAMREQPAPARPRDADVLE